MTQLSGQSSGFEGGGGVGLPEGLPPRPLPFLQGCSDSQSAVLIALPFGTVCQEWLAEGASAHAWAGLKKAGEISSDACELIEGIVEAPILAVQFLHIRAAKAKVCFLLERHFRRVIEEGCGEELSLSAEGLGGLGLHGLLVLLLA